MGTSILIHGTAANNLNIPWYALPFSGWKQELADSSAWAFSQAVAGVLSNTYTAPLERIANDDGDFDVDFHHTTRAHSTTKTDDDHAIDEKTLNIDDMLEESLKELYQSAHESGRENIQITLRSKPVSAHFISCFWVPYLTRQQVKEKPNLKRTFQKMQSTVDQKLVNMEKATPTSIDVLRLVFKELDDFSKRQTINHEHYSCVESTVVALVQVECDEIFSVVDLNTDTVLQGHADHKIRRVSHVVRLEQVVNWVMHDTRGFFVENGMWQITDWDDLLHGNIFFMEN